MIRLFTGFFFLFLLLALVGFIFPPLIMIPLAAIMCTKGSILIPLSAFLVPVGMVLIPLAYLLGDLFLGLFQRSPSVSDDRSATAPIKPGPEPVKTRKSILAICTYIRESLEAGYSVDRIQKDLKIAGWKDDEIKEALSIEDRKRPT